MHARPVTLAALLALIVLVAPGAARGQTTSLSPDEVVEFYPTEAVFDAARKVWVAPVQALVFEPQRDASARRAQLSSLANAIGLPGDSWNNETFAQRARSFLVDDQRDQRLVVALAGVTAKLDVSDRSGQAHGSVEVPAAAAEEARDPSHPDWLTVSLVVPSYDTRRFEGRARLLPPTGLSVVSDLDALLELSGVTDRKLVLARTFLEPFQAVPGLAPLYASCAAEGAAFHYVSAGPWQLHAPLTEFLGASGFPPGPIALRELAWKEQKFAEWFASADAHKEAAIMAIGGQFPERGLILVGDSGGKDPEIFGRIARTWPARVERILIRDVTGEPIKDARYTAAFKNVPPERWTLFKSADELSSLRAPPAPAAPKEPEAPSDRHAVPPLR